MNLFFSSGRAVAKEMGMSYFETSVLTFFGVNEVFENAIRAALCSRRTQRFWMTNLRRVLKPALQVCGILKRSFIFRESIRDISKVFQDMTLQGTGTYCRHQYLYS